MGCGSSKDKNVQRSNSRKYLASGAGNDGFPGIPLYNAPAGPLTAKEYKERLVTSEGTQSVHLPRSGYTIRYAFVSQRGYYPDSPDKQNQDSFCVHTSFNGDPEQLLFGVFDGHGEAGTQCSQFARDKVPLNLVSSAHFSTNPALAFHQAMVQTNLQCHRSEFDDSMSGTTAITVLIRGRSLLIANVGDSRAVLAEKVPAGHGFIARDLSIDQTPYRKDECDRVRAAGARVATLDQVEGLKDPTIECWTTEEEDEGDPPRLWFPNGMYPGTAFTRSIGDAAAERIGVFAEPELEFRHLGPNNAFLVIASDGVFEFISSQRVVDMVAKFDDLYDACLSVVAESYRIWLQYETRTDDITMIMLQFVGLDTPAPSALSRTSLPTYPGQLQQQVPAVNGSAPPAAQQQQQQQWEHQQEQPPQQQQGDQAAAAATGKPYELSPLGVPGAPGEDLQLQPPVGMRFPLRGHLVDDIEASAGLVTSQQQETDQPVSLWFQSHNFIAPSNNPAQQAGVAASPASAAGQQNCPHPAADSAAASAATAAAAMYKQQSDQFDLGHITLQQYKMLETTVNNNFLFNHLTKADRLLVYKCMDRVEFKPNEVIINQGDRGDHFYIVEAGVLDVMVATADVSATITPTPVASPIAENHNQQQQLQHLQGQPQKQQDQQQLIKHQRQQLAAATKGAVKQHNVMLPPRMANLLIDNDLMAGGLPNIQCTNGALHAAAELVPLCDKNTVGLKLSD
eukprot:GHRR01008191.1.p1 GENE.GHRR01008191.1~~GHRR01008191.1.p1  ORF type:complete len:736 (+),score=253.14 GHRR01008191.1:238-2445(+)